MISEEEKVVLLDEEGQEHEFAFIDVLEVDGERYAVLAPVEGLENDSEEETEAVILKIGKDENGEDILSDIEDDEEWEKVVAEWQQLVESEEEDIEEDEEE
ncbi:MAG: DUF1292 domain-containing protein [Clostridia bacterium]|jgi:hypothetical protein|nr:DUF1292 domain-containing protein [Clostridia bacterium]